MEMTLIQKIDKAKKLILKYTKSYPKHSFAFSGGKDSSVLLHLATQTLGGHLRRTLRVDAVLSNNEFTETHDYISWFSKVYQVEINRHFYINDPSKPDQASKDNKVEKFKEVMSDVDCWFSGIRRDEGATRTEISDVQTSDDIVKVNPIADFTEKDVWRYLAIYEVPVNTIYKAGYRSLSCQLSSTPEVDGAEPERAGRWKGTTCEGGECGIHSKPLK